VSLSAVTMHRVAFCRPPFRMGIHSFANRDSRQRSARKTFWPATRAGHQPQARISSAAQGPKVRMTRRWREQDSNRRSHLKEEPAELHLFDSVALLSIARVRLGVSAPRAGRGGTASSNPLCSSGESDANLTNTRRNSDRQAGRGYRSKAAKTALSPFI
jgi:hypothetical protein